MTRVDLELKHRLDAFKIDDPEASFPFSARLARENRWSQEYTHRVIEEYKRFAYLAMAAGHPVTPSVDVDQVWHLHLTYTRSYWEEFCPVVLGRPLHHGPTKGGQAEGAKFHDWYSRTLESYESHFGHKPPVDIWPNASDRFARQARIYQVSDATHWVIPKPRDWRISRRAGFALLALGLTGCSALVSSEGLRFFAVIGFAVVLWLLLLVVDMFRDASGASRLRSGNQASRLRRSQADSSSSGCSSAYVDSGDGGDSGCGSGCGGCGGCG